MALRAPKKKQYTGPKLTGDTLKARLDRAKKNSQSVAYVSNESFAVTDELFKRKCVAAGIPPTGRQASKFRRGMGKAFNTEVKDG